jgi:branched-chain amino acid transport system substrate-binding protein
VFSLFGYVGTPTSNAALGLVNQHKVPFIAPFTGAELLRTPVNPYVFNVRASYYQETAALVQRLLDKGKRKIAVFHQDDSYGQAGLDGVRLAMDRNGLAIIATGTVERNSTNVADAVKAISATKPDGVILVSAYASCAEFIRQAKASGLKDTEFLNVSFVGSKALVNDLWLDGQGVVVSQVVPFPADEAIPIVAEYTRISRYFSDLVVPSYGSLEGFIAAKVLVEGLQRTGRELTRERLVRALDSIQNLDLGGFQLSWSPDDHGGSNFVDITVIGQQDRWVY